MVWIEVAGWTDRSSGEPRPAFAVSVVGVASKKRGSAEEELVEEIAISAAVDRLERELRWVSENFDRLVRGVLVGSKGFSMHMLYALFLLAAARANVNPAYVIFVYKNEGLKEVYLTDVINSLTEFFNPHYNVLGRFVERLSVVRRSRNAALKSWQAIDELIQIVRATRDNADEHTRLLLAYLLDSLSSETKAFNHKIDISLTFQEVKDFYRRAAEEARDPDLKRLAEILAELVDLAVMLTYVLEYNFRIPDLLLYKVSSPYTFKEGKREVLERLESAKDRFRGIEDKVEQLVHEATGIVWRLRKKGVLLDPELNMTEEEIKRQLLEA